MTIYHYTDTCLLCDEVVSACYLIDVSANRDSLPKLVSDAQARVVPGVKINTSVRVGFSSGSTSNILLILPHPGSDFRLCRSKFLNQLSFAVLF